MRPKFFIIVTTFGLVVLGTLFAIRQTADHPARNSGAQPATSGITQPSDSAKTEPVAEPTSAATKNGPQPESQPASASEDAHREYVEKRSGELMDMAMTDDRASLDIILSELTNRDPEIRKAALEAAIQFGSRDAIPKMTEAAAQTDDPSEKTAIADAIEFLKLPSLTEVTAHSARPVATSPSTGATKPARRGALAKRVSSAAPSNQ
jgi:HEAT repeat protein